MSISSLPQPKRLRRQAHAPIARDDPLLPPTAAAPYIGIAVNTLNNWRAERRPGRVIPFLKVGGAILYRKSALDAFLTQCERNG